MNIRSITSVSKRSALRGGWILLYALAAMGVLLAPDYLVFQPEGLGLFSLQEAFGAHFFVDSMFVLASIVGFLELLRRRERSSVLVDDRAARIVRNIEVGVAAVDEGEVVRYANEAFVAMFGASAHEVPGRAFDTLLDRHSVVGTLPLLLTQGASTQKITVMHSGTAKTLLLRTERIDERGRGWIVTAQDLTKDERLLHTQGLYERAMGVCEEGIVVTDASLADMPVIYVNQAFTDITGYAAHELLGKNMRLLQGHERNQPEVNRIAEAIRDQKPITLTMRNYRKSGEQFWNRLRLAPALDSKGQLRNYVGSVCDVTELRHATEELERTSKLDQLTSLHNRTGFRDILRPFLAEAGELSVLFVKINIEAFHEINATFGYSAGDALLVQVAKRLAEKTGAIAARLDGDTFALGLRVPAQEIRRALDELQSDLGRPFVVPGATLRVFFYIGYSVGDRGTWARHLMRQGSAALHEARKLRARVPYEYDERLDKEITRRIRVSGDLQQAVANSDLVLHYQPKVDLRTGHIIGAEALMRWAHPTFGLQLPDRFIPTAEHTGLIVPMGEWALRAAARCAAELNRSGAEPCQMSVNVSLMQFRQTDFPSVVETVLEETGLDPQLMTFELTESLFAEESESLRDALLRIRGLGIGLSIDDFGTGYSSLRYVGAFPVTEIKIDRAFVKEMRNSSHKRAVIEAVTHLGRDLRVRVVAEGIETETERLMLIDLGCDYGQGYYFSMPLVEEDFTSLVTRGSPLPVRAPHLRPLQEAS